MEEPRQGFPRGKTCKLEGKNPHKTKKNLSASPEGDKKHLSGKGGCGTWSRSLRSRHKESRPADPKTGGQ